MPSPPLSRPHVLGIDTGGTYTDAALIERATGRVVRTAKALTTYPDPSEGILGSARALGVPLDSVERVCLATTLATNALVEGLGARVGLVLLGFREDVLARSGLAERLPAGPRAALPGAMGPGGAESAPLDEDAVASAIAAWRGQVDALAICGVFAIRNPDHEVRVREISDTLLGVPVVMSHTISEKLDAITRAATAALNARLLPVVHRFLDALRPALAPLGLGDETPLFLVRGDGCLMTESLSRQRPLETFLSGPAASAMGAAFLAGSERAVVLDIGGTTSDISLLDGGQVLLSREGATVGGYRTHIAGLHGTTLGLGGDSHVRVLPDGSIEVGPRRVVPVSHAVRAHGLSRDAVEERIVWRNDGLPDFLVATESDEAGARGLEAELLAVVREGPIAVEALARRLGLASPILLPLSRLLAHRALLGIAPTPTDFLAAAGETDHVDVAVARTVVYRVAEAADTDDASLIVRVKDEIADRLAANIARTCLERSHPRAVWERGVETVLEPTPKGALLHLRATLDAPVVGLGAPAGRLVPRAAERLGSECLIPAGAEVGGAVGAAAATVRGIVHVVVRAVYGVAGISHYVVHSRLKPEFYEERSSALERGRAIAEQLAREEALAGMAEGADGIAVAVEAEEATARDAGGSVLWLETAIRAVARIAEAAR